MTRTKLILFACFCAVFAAGAAAGIAVGHVATRPRPGSWLGHELNLTAEQREQMRQIWSSAMKGSPQQDRERREALRKERDDAVKALLTDEQKAHYEKVMQTYSQQTAAMEAERRKAFEEAVERTKQILTESQRKKYEQMLQERGGRHPGGGPPGGGPPGVAGPGRPGPGREPEPPPRGE